MSRPDFSVFADILPDLTTRKRRRPRARFELRVEWGSTNMEADGTKRDLYAEFDLHVERADKTGLTAAFVYRNGYVIREWRRA